MLTSRLLIPDDAPEYVRLRKQMLVESPWAFGSSPEIDRVSDVEHVRTTLTLAQATASGTAPAAAESAMAGAFAGDVLAGVAVVRREDRPKRRHIAGVFSVYVMPEYRSRGAGKLALELAIATAGSWPGVACIQLAVSEKALAAQALYRKLGFVEWGREPDALRVDGQSFDERHMVLRC